MALKERLQYDPHAPLRCFCWPLARRENSDVLRPSAAIAIKRPQRDASTNPAFRGGGTIPLELTTKTKRALCAGRKPTKRRADAAGANDDASLRPAGLMTAESKVGAMNLVVWWPAMFALGLVIMGPSSARGSWRPRSTRVFRQRGRCDHGDRHRQYPRSAYAVTARPLRRCWQGQFGVFTGENY